MKSITRNIKFLTYIVSLMVISCLIVGLGPSQSFAEGEIPFININYDTANEVKIHKVHIYKKHELGDQPTIHILLLLENIAKQPVRFEVFVESDNGLYASSLIPFKGKVPKVLKPGDQFKAVFPTWLTEAPKELNIDIKTTDFLE